MGNIIAVTGLLQLLFISGCAHTGVTGSDISSCTEHTEQYAKASAELKILEIADQADRQGSVNAIDWTKVSPRDLDRRIKVATLFAESCFREGKDYSAAAMIYQHGEGADHPFQAFIWAKRALELGDVGENKWLMAAALDRFLVRSGQKELFATQYSKDAGSECWCLEPTEMSFPDTQRVEYTKKTIQQAIEGSKRFDANPETCVQVSYCKHDLKSSPTGTVPGFW